MVQWLEFQTLGTVVPMSWSLALLNKAPTLPWMFRSRWQPGGANEEGSLCIYKRKKNIGNEEQIRSRLF